MTNSCSEGSASSVQMSIKVLSPDTIRVLGATQCITSPVSVVKELIDNALDAHSTSLFIECAANLLDIIQVRDNGCGIRPDCRDLLGTKYCTSKIDSVADLDDAGGTWLGFRGEALASIAEISSTLTMTTRTASEEVGSLLEIGRDGKQKGLKIRSAMPKLLDANCDITLAKGSWPTLLAPLLKSKMFLLMFAFVKRWLKSKFPGTGHS